MNRLKELREQKKISQNELANLTVARMNGVQNKIVVTPINTDKFNKYTNSTPLKKPLN